MLAAEAEKCGLVSSVFESKVAKLLQEMVWKNIANIWAASSLFISYLQEIIRNGKRQERHSHLDIFGCVHPSSLRIKVSLAFFTGLHEKDKNNKYVYLFRKTIVNIWVNSAHP